MKESKLLHLLDPHKQSVFYFQTNLSEWFVFLMACTFFYIHKDNILVLCLLCNPLFAYPNVFVHSLFGHFLLGPLMQHVFRAILGFILPAVIVDIVGQLLLVGAGSFSEILLPVIGIIICLRIVGGRWVLPVLLYWLSVSIFDLGAYIVNPSSQLDLLAYNPEPSSCESMVTLFGEPVSQADAVGHGDWAFILNMLGLQEYAEPIGNAIIFLAIACFVLAVWSPFYYWRHMDQYPVSGREV